MRYKQDFPFLLLVFLLSLSVPLVSGTADSKYAHVYYVRPTNDTSHCPGVPCLTLTEYLQDATTKYPFYNATLKFLPGSHVLSFPMIVGSVTNLALVLEDNSDMHNTSIVCRVGNLTYHSYLHFKGTRNLTIDGLRFYSCGGGSKRGFTVGLHEYTLAGSLQFEHVINLTLSNIIVEDSFMNGICAFNVIGTIRIIGAKFLNNSMIGLSPHVSVAYSMPPERKSTSEITLNTTLNIENTTLIHGVGGALCLHLVQTYPVNVSILNVSTVGFSDNPALSPFEGTPDLGIDIVCELQTDHCRGSSVRISGSQISGHLGGGLRFLSSLFLKSVIEDTVIRSNSAQEESGAALSIGTSKCGPTSLPPSIPETTTRPTADGWVDWQPIRLMNVKFTNNSYYSPNGAIATPIATISTFQDVSFINCTFTDNVGSIVLAGTSNVTFINSTFISNVGTCILAESSNFTLSGTIQFIENFAYEGSGLAFYANSHMLLDSNTDILFASNFAADVGGAIYIDSSASIVIVLPDWRSITYTDCFMKPPPFDSVTVSLTFMNNTSVNGGDNIYGGLVYPCIISGSSSDPVEIINSYFHFDPPNASISSLASNPLRACLCRNGKPDCLVIFSEEEHKVYPGQTFTLSAVLVGERFGAVSGAISAQLLAASVLSNYTSPALGHLQHSQVAGAHKCTELEYTIYSRNEQELLVVTAYDIPLKGIPDGEEVINEISYYNETGVISPQLLSYPVVSNVTLLPCPLGFVLTGKHGGCVCEAQLNKSDIKCNLTDQTIHRSGTLWVNASFNGNVSNGVIICKYCPFDFCKSENVDVNLENPDSQCDLGHSGIACGGCQPELSLMIGSSRCQSCSNRYLGLLVTFAIAGFALVFFIKLLNLTVSKGTINGLFFYANIIGADQSIFFLTSKSNPFTHILTVFIAWLNLDLGIETCFFDGLDAYWKTWLQFVFPFYIWGIIGLIIILSRISELARKIFGSNPPDVLATLVLLSYTKLLRTIIIALSFTLLDMPDGSREAVWSFDGNIPYLKGKHIALFVVALLVLLLLWLPFTVVLMFWQLLQRISDYRIVRWVVIKQKPFFDAYFGPLRGEHRYWVGVLLLVRGILLIVFAVTPANAVRVDLLAISTMSALLLAYLAILPHVKQQTGGRRALAAFQNVSLTHKIRERLCTFTGSCYTIWYLSILESSFILNLLVLSVVTLYAYSSNEHQAAVVDTFVGIAFVQFAGIVCLHAYASLRKCWRVKKVVADAGVRDVGHVEEEVAGPVDYSEYREPLLGLDDN